MMIKILAVFFFYLILFPLPAEAQFYLEEGKVVLLVSPGDRINKTMTIHNTTAESVQVLTTWEDFKYQPPYDGTKVFLPAGTAAGSLSQRVNYTPQTFTLPPFGKQVVDYTISIPDQFEGGHYGVLFFERGGDPIKDDAGVSIITRVGALFFVEPKEAIRKAVLDQFKIDNGLLRGGFSNQGNVILIPATSYYIMDKEGLVTDRGELKKMYVPPLESSAFEISLPSDLKADQYNLFINADLGGGDVVVKEIELVKDLSGSITIQNVRD
jgi:hypothetical protein